MESWWDPTEPHRDTTSALHLNSPYTPLRAPQPFSRIPKAHSWSWIGLRWFCNIWAPPSSSPWVFTGSGIGQVINSPQNHPGLDFNRQKWELHGMEY